MAEAGAPSRQQQVAKAQRLGRAVASAGHQWTLDFTLRVAARAVSRGQVISGGETEVPRGPGNHATIKEG